MSRRRRSGSSLNRDKREMILNRFIPADGRSFRHAAWKSPVGAGCNCSLNRSYTRDLCCCDAIHDQPRV